MKAPKPNITRILPPQGTHIARVVELIYEGTQKVEWKGETKEIPKVRIKWELPFKKAAFKEGEDEKPFVVSAEYSHSMGKKSNLLPIVEGIIGTSLSEEEAFAFDLDEVLNMPCLLSIAIKEGDKGKFVIVNSTSPLMEGQTCPDTFNKPRILSFEKWNEEIFESLPDFIKEKIEASPEYKKLKGLAVTGNASSADAPNPDDIPF